MKLDMLLWIVVLAFIEAVSSLRLMSLYVPQLAFSGQEVVLNCVFDMEDNTLYSIKWYRDDMEFFRYVPSERPTNQFFSLKGLNVDLSRSSNSTMYITDVDVTTSGIYKCEISADAPSFQTVSAEKVLKIEEVDDNSSSITNPRFLPICCFLLFCHVIL